MEGLLIESGAYIAVFMVIYIVLCLCGAVLMDWMDRER